MENLMRRVYIKSEADLPENGFIIVHQRHTNRLQEIDDAKQIDPFYKSGIDWYLSPVSRVEIIEILKGYLGEKSSKFWEVVADEIIGGVK